MTVLQKLTPPPPELLIMDFHDPIVGIVNSTYPDFINNYQSSDYLWGRAILASTLEVVDDINDHILALMPSCHILPFI